MFKMESIKLKPYQKEIFIFLSLVLIAFIIFYPSFLNQNYFWDDERFIFLNPEVLQAPTWYSFWNDKSEFFKSWPLGYSIFWSLIKYSPFNSFNFYKSLNIIFHGLNAYLIFKIIKKFNFPFATLLTLVFLLHPMQVETVSWIFQLLTILSFTFFLISFLLLLKFTNKNSFIFLIFSFLFFVFSLWTKSIALFSPLMFILVFWIFNVKKKLYFLLIPFFIASFYVGFVNLRGTQFFSNQAKVKNQDIAESLFNVFDSNIQGLFPVSTSKIKMDDNKLYFDFIFKKNKKKSEFIFDRFKIFRQAPWHYLSKVLVPFNLQFIYPERAYHLILISISIFSLFILPFVLCFIFKDKLFAIIPAMSLVFLVPYLGITNIAFFYWSNVSDRYVYCFIIVLVLALGFLGKKYNNKNFKIFLGCYCLFLAIQNLNYGFKFNEPLKLYKEILEYKPHPVIYSLLFEQYLIKLDAKNAKSTLNDGLSKFPDDPQLDVDKLRLNGLEHFTK